MKVLALLVLTVALGSAARSGPYLPSGWKPDGPAFFLPGETQKPSDTPLKETLQIDAGSEVAVEPESESQAEGSDALREYGPPKLSANQVTVQGLPDEATETAFSSLRSNVGDDTTVGNTDDEPKTEGLEGRSGDLTDETTESKPEDTSDVPTEGKTADETPDNATDGSVVTEAQNAVTDANNDVTVVNNDVTEANKDVTEASNDVTEAKDDTATETSTDVTPVEGEGKSADIEEVTEGEKDADSSDDSNVESKFGNEDIAGDLEKLENEIKEQQDTSTEAVPETKSENTADVKSADVPEGFLEYGPPGFREYGPPKEEVTVEEKSADSATESVESNEARRRRFSPKFNKAKKAARKH